MKNTDQWKIEESKHRRLLLVLCNTCRDSPPRWAAADHALRAEVNGSIICVEDDFMAWNGVMWPVSEYRREILEFYRQSREQWAEQQIGTFAS